MFLWKTFNSDSISEAKKPNEIHLLALDVFWVLCLYSIELEYFLNN
jgi:hypothetical protein